MKKKIFKLVAFIIVIIFILVNVIWGAFYLNQKSKLKKLMLKYRMEKSAPSNVYLCQNYDSDYTYNYVLPDYLCFRIRFQAIDSYNLSENDKGQITAEKKYHGSINVNRYVWESNWFCVEIDQAADDDGVYLDTSACERIDYYPGFIEKKVWFGISDKGEDQVRNFFVEADEEVNEVYNKAVEFFGDEYLR